MTVVNIVLLGAAFYLLLTLCLAYVVQCIPRRPVDDRPDWGRITDTQISHPGGGFLEVWKVQPDQPSRGTVLLVHGWGRNRGRMVNRARIFGEMGFTTVMHSSRDHGSSSACRFMNAPRFAEDIEAVLEWVKEPVLLYGHSIGAVAALLAARRHPDRIRLLFLEGCYAETRKALRRLYRGYSPIPGFFLAPMIVLWMDLFYRFRLNEVSPIRVAKEVDLPVLLIHGEDDPNFPLQDAWKLRDSFPAGRAELFVALGADHSNSSLAPGYPKALDAFVNRHLP
jgi:uncharacterized protein